VSASATAIWVTALIAVGTVAAAGAGWYRAGAELNSRKIRNSFRALQSNAALKTDPEILGSYLAKIRADGVANHADMKQRLDRLAENNSAIVALTYVCTPHVKTAAFSTEAQRFARYAIAWRDRWNSVMELFMAGGNYPVAEVPFPRAFIDAVQTEIEAQRVFRPF
jgi:hypothetical protein